MASVARTQELLGSVKDLTGLHSAPKWALEPAPEQRKLSASDRSAAHNPEAEQAESKAVQGARPSEASNSSLYFNPVP